MRTILSKNYNPQTLSKGTLELDGRFGLYRYQGGRFTLIALPLLRISIYNIRRINAFRFFHQSTYEFYSSVLVELIGKRNIKNGKETL